jgi:glycerol uptake facilitator-like aquaporin
MAINKHSNELAAGFAGATVAALSMLLLGIGWNIGVYVGAAEQMAKWHYLFSPSIGGIIGGMVEAAVITFVFVYLFVWLYHKFE